jgi:hypothetical protein
VKKRAVLRKRGFWAKNEGVKSQGENKKIVDCRIAIGDCF